MAELYFTFCLGVVMYDNKIAKKENINLKTKTFTIVVTQRYKLHVASCKYRLKTNSM